MSDLDWEGCPHGVIKSACPACSPDNDAMARFFDLFFMKEIGQYAILRDIELLLAGPFANARQKALAVQIKHEAMARLRTLREQS